MQVAIKDVGYARADPVRLLEKRGDLQFQDVMPISVRAIGIESVAFGFETLGFLGEHSLLRIKLVEMVWRAERHRTTVYGCAANREANYVCPVLHREPRGNWSAR